MDANRENEETRTEEEEKEERMKEAVVHTMRYGSQKIRDEDTRARGTCRRRINEGACVHSLLSLFLLLVFSTREKFVAKVSVR